MAYCLDRRPRQYNLYPILYLRRTNTYLKRSGIAIVATYIPMPTTMTAITARKPKTATANPTSSVFPSCLACSACRAYLCACRSMFSISPLNLLTQAIFILLYRPLLLLPNTSKARLKSLYRISEVKSRTPLPLLSIVQVSRQVLVDNINQVKRLFPIIVPKVCADRAQPGNDCFTFQHPASLLCF